MTDAYALPSDMQAVSVAQPGGPEVLTPLRMPLPSVRDHEVLIEVHAAGVNRPDCLQRAGHYPVPPDASPLPGLEVAGVVVRCGAEVTRWKQGDRVVALTHGGGYAEYCAAAAGHCLPWPAALNAAEAATLPETLFTVHHNLIERARLARGETVLIHGGSSGIGTTAIQVAKAWGATVITTAGSDEKVAYCQRMGADHAINYREGDWEATVKELTRPGGVDVVLDMVAGPYVMKNLRLLGNDGRYAMIAFLMGATTEVNFAYLLPKRLTITGSTLRPQPVERKAAIARAVEQDFWPLLASGQLTTHIHAHFPLTAAADAHRMMEASDHMGKLVLDVKPPV
jgi:putative PIG3 family NAD(P)H quinone oxidoreductase